MNKVICAVALLVCNVVFGGQPSSTIPHGGEVYVQGQTQEFVYGGKVAKTLTVELSRDGGLTYEMIGTVENKDRARRNKFVWVVSGATSLNARVKFTSIMGRKTISVVSSSFIITDTQGLSGKQGEPGAQGPAGSPGVAGAVGAQGLPGESGSMGLPGADGLNADPNDVARILKNDKSFIALIVKCLDLNDIIKILKCDLDFIKSCKGDQGIRGLQGLRGEIGPRGADGKDCECNCNKCSHCNGHDKNCKWCAGRGCEKDYKEKKDD